MNHDLYMELICHTLSDTCPSEAVLSAVSVEELYDFAVLNKLSPFLVNILSYYPIHSEFDRDFASYWKSEAAHTVFLEYKKYSLVKHLVNLAKERNVPLVFFKGYLLADLYPDFTMRTSSDTDLLVDPVALHDAMALLEELQYTRISSLDTENVFTYIYKENDYPLHKIELHTSLFEEIKGAQVSYLETLNLAAPEKRISVTCCGMSIQTLNHQEHLIYQIFHMVKHLGFHGLPIRYLLDIALFIKKYGSFIDWTTFTATMEALGYTLVWQCFSTLLIRYFSVSDDILCGKKVCCHDVSNELLIDMLSFGMRSHDKEISHYFFYFERYIERLEATAGHRLDNISFDCNTVPANIVPLDMQQNKVLQKRIQFLQHLELI